MTEPLAYTLRQAAEACGLSVGTLGRAVRAGRLRAKITTLTADGRPAGKFIILRAELERWLEELPDY